jgi:hypothetical protein
MKNIHILPTDKPSRLFYDISIDKLVLATTYEVSKWFDNKNIYITSDEEIKQGDWYLNPRINKVLLCDSSNLEAVNLSNVKKIILTTDQYLIKDGVQAIDEEFLKWFIENPSCEFVEVEELSIEDIIEEWWQDLSNEELIDVYKKTDNFRLGGWGHDIGPTEEDVRDMYLEIHNLSSKQLKANYYKIIIPQEEPKQNSCDIIFETASLFDNEQETLEEAKQRILDSNFMTLNDAYIFEMGVRWQAKRMYNEEDLHNAFYNGWIYRGETYSFPEAKKEWLKNLNK